MFKSALMYHPLIFLVLLHLIIAGCAATPLTPTTWLPANSELLKQPLFLNKCLNQDLRIFSKTFSIQSGGLRLHPNPSSIRTKTWEELLELPPKTILKDNQIGVSILPYFTDKFGKKWFLVPQLPTSKFNQFLLSCQPEILEDHFFKMPYYYPTLTLTIDPTESRDTLVASLKKQLQQNLELTEVPLASDYFPSLLTLLPQLLKTTKFSKQFPQIREITLAEAPQLEIHFPLSWPKQLGKLTISNCKETSENEQNYWVDCTFSEGHPQHILSQAPTPPLRKLIIVSLSAELDLQGTGKIIQNAFYNLLKDKPLIKVPFTLLAISSGRQLTQILTSEELTRFTITGESDELWSKIRQLQFGAFDLDALDDLELIDVYAINRQLPLNRIFYLTDNLHLAAHPPRKHLGVPLAWQREGIQLTVLTTQQCTVWEKLAAANCIRWQDKQLATLANYLREFLLE